MGSGLITAGTGSGPPRVGISAQAVAWPSERCHPTVGISIVVLNLGVLALLWLLGAAVTSGLLLWMYGLAQLVLYLSHVLYLLRANAHDPLDGLNVLNLGFFLHFTLVPFLIWYEVMPAFYASLWEPADFARALVLAHATGVAVQAGYYMNALPGRGFPFLRGSVSTVRLVIFAVLIAVGLFAGVPLPFEKTTPQVFPGGGIYIAITTIAVYAPYVLIILRPRRGAPVVSGIVLATAVYAGASSLVTGIGSKAGVVSLILSYAIYRHYLVRPLGVRALGTAVLLGTAVVVYMNYMRAVGYLAGIDTWAVNPLTPDNLDVLWAAGVSSTLTPFESLMVVLRTFPTILPYQAGKRLLEDMLYPLLPRALFPEKPIFYGAAFFWEYHRGFLTLDTPVFEAISLPGHFYLDFGVPGVLAGAFLVGWLQRLVYRRLLKGTITPATVALYAIFSSYSMIASRAFFWTTQTIIVALVVPTLLLRLLLKHGAR